MNYAKSCGLPPWWEDCQRSASCSQLRRPQLAASEADEIAHPLWYVHRGHDGLGNRRCIRPTASDREFFVRRQRLSWPAFVAGFSLLAGIATFSFPAASHDWYPMECCNGIDCAPVESTAHTRPIGSGSVPDLIVTTKHGSAVVPKNFPVGESRDHRMHACMLPRGNGLMQIICIFLPPSN
jgi:hypothetical protein